MGSGLAWGGEGLQQLCQAAGSKQAETDQQHGPSGAAPPPSAAPAGEQGGQQGRRRGRRGRLGRLGRGKNGAGADLHPAMPRLGKGKVGSIEIFGALREKDGP